PPSARGGQSPHPDRSIRRLPEGQERGELQIPRLRLGRHRHTPAGLRPARARIITEGPAGLLWAVLGPDGAGAGPGGLGRVGRPLSADDRLTGRGARGGAGVLAGHDGRPPGRSDREAGAAALATIPEAGGAGSGGTKGSPALAGGPPVIRRLPGGEGGPGRPPRGTRPDRVVLRVRLGRPGRGPARPLEPGAEG